MFYYVRFLYKHYYPNYFHFSYSDKYVASQRIFLICNYFIKNYALVQKWFASFHWDVNLEIQYFTCAQQWKRNIFNRKLQKTRGICMVTSSGSRFANFLDAVYRQHKQQNSDEKHKCKQTAQ